MNYKKRLEFHDDRNIVLATIRKRSAAFLIDWLILVIVYFSFIILSGVINMNISKINVHGIFDVELEMSNTPSFVITIVKVLFGLLPVLYFTFSFYFFNGQTIGKYFLRIRILSLYHQRPGLWHCVERSLGYFASAVEFGFGFIQAFWNPNRMALHDKIGETIVIKCPVKK